MARTFIDVDQSQYISLGGSLGAYGVSRDILTMDNLADLSVDELNALLPMVHLNRYHQNENGQAAGMARVLQVKWVKPALDGRGQYPYVRLRELPFGMVGDAETARRRYTVSEILEHLEKYQEDR